jgi:ubiquinone/menaquinone biosynthesis C-methylase UbiE
VVRPPCGRRGHLHARRERLPQAPGRECREAGKEPRGGPAGRPDESGPSSDSQTDHHQGAFQRPFNDELVGPHTEPAPTEDAGELGSLNTKAGARRTSRRSAPDYASGVKAYYEARAREYDDWVYGTGLFTERHRHGWHEERERMQDAVAAMPAERTLDIACGTGWLTQHLQGEIVGLDASPAMLEVAAERIPSAEFLVGDALDLPFEDRSFERITTGHFYGHLEEAERIRFLAEAHRVAGELVVIDSALHDGVEPVEWQERVLNDGSRWEVYKRYFVASELADELGGGDVLFDGNWFVVVRSRG